MVTTYRKIMFKIFIGLFSLYHFVGCNATPEGSGITVPPGFKAEVFADEVGRARHIVVNENGDVYVAMNNTKKGGGIAALRDTSGDGKADVIKYFSEYHGTGVEIYNGYLYFSSDTAVMRYNLNNNELVPSTLPEFIARGFEYGRQHRAKPFAFNNSGHLFVNVGAPNNACQESFRTPGSPGMDPCPVLDKFAGIWRFDAERLNQDQINDGYHFATGIRHAVAINWNPLVNKLYVVQHGRDQLNQLWPDLYTNEQNAELPAEEFLLVEDQSNFGWPYCYYDHLQGKKVLAPEYGGDGKITGRCSEADDPILAFPGHLAPNDLHFYTGKQFPQKYYGGAFIAFHGSWNRSPLLQKGYQVVFVPFDGDKPAGSYEIFADGFAGTDKISGPGDARYRPVGIAQAEDGSLFISDSKEGRIWHITYSK